MFIVWCCPLLDVFLVVFSSIPVSSGLFSGLFILDFIIITSITANNPAFSHL